MISTLKHPSFPQNSPAAVEQSYSQTLKLIAKQPSTAFVILRSLALGGHVKSQLRVGLMYLNGRGVQKDYDQAERWIITAAKNRNVEATMLLRRIQSYYDPLL